MLGLGRSHLEIEIIVEPFCEGCIEPSDFASHGIKICETNEEENWDWRRPCN